ncbi:MAG: hypothetical protein OXP75_03875, partial [Rhodospirillales bacterium]|nr:hypothetical protein [Rhodospirillales bacterium]
TPSRLDERIRALLRDRQQVDEDADVFVHPEGERHSVSLGSGEDRLAAEYNGTAACRKRGWADRARLRVRFWVSHRNAVAGGANPCIELLPY